MRQKIGINNADQNRMQQRRTENMICKSQNTKHKTEKSRENGQGREKNETRKGCEKKGEGERTTEHTDEIKFFPESFHTSYHYFETPCIGLSPYIISLF